MTSDDLGIDGDVLARWLDGHLDDTVTGVEATRLSGGNSSGAWRLSVGTSAGERLLVLKVTGDQGIVFEGDAAREGAILAGAGALGAPVAEVVAIDGAGEVAGRPSFVMTLVEGQAIPDSDHAGTHGDGWFRDATLDRQRALWLSFIDSLARLHAIDTSTLDRAQHGTGGAAGMLDHWQRSLLDALPADLAPRQLRALEWLRSNMPSDVGSEPALCMGDARLGNAIVHGNTVRALVDFEVAYIGHPAADVGYALVYDRITRQLSDRPATGIPSDDETWARWADATGRTLENNAYWSALGATVMCITGTRAMLSWGFAPESIDRDSIVLAEWERLIDIAAG